MPVRIPSCHRLAAGVTAALLSAGAVHASPSTGLVVPGPLDRSGAAAAGIGARPQGGPTVVIQNCNDDGVGSLRSAYANSVDGEVIDLRQLACSTITLTSGPLVSSAAAGYVILQGDYNRPLTIDANHADRVLVHRGTRIAARDLVLRNGATNDAAGGGCIRSTGDVVLVSSTVDACDVNTFGTTAAKGGAISADGVAFVIASRVTHARAHAAAANADGGGVHARYVITAAQSTIAGNTANGDGSHYARGGGAYGTEGVRMDECTVSGNQADTGGGVFIGPAAFASMRFLDSTIADNHASGAAGGIFAAHSIDVQSSTISGNTAVFDFGAGVYVSVGDVHLASSIVANNTSGDGLNAADVAGHAGAQVIGDHNLVLASTLVLPAGTVQADPHLGPLQDNGGDVETVALLAGSPAIDAGANPGGEYTDARGYDCAPSGGCVTFERTVGAATDIGAFEFGAPDFLFADSFEFVTRVPAGVSGR